MLEDLMLGILIGVCLPFGGFLFGAMVYNTKPEFEKRVRKIVKIVLEEEKK